MKILVDLIHPANFHYFKYFVYEMRKKGHCIIITARNKDVLHNLLEIEGFRYISTRKGYIGPGAMGKLFYLLYAEIRFFFIFRKYKFDIAISFGSTPCAHNAFLSRVPHIAFDDTEHAKLNRKLYAPFTNLIITPKCFYENIGKKQFRFDGYMELFYLSKKRFFPQKSIMENIVVEKERKNVLIRFISWEAYHDIGQKKLSLCDKIKIVETISQYANVFISSEGELPTELIKYRLKIESNKLHDFMAFCSLYIGEGGTTASESVLLGVPAIYTNSLPLMGYLVEQKKAGLLFHLDEVEEILSLTQEILTDKDAKFTFERLKEELVSNMIDPTSFLVWLVENYPDSKNKLLSKPELQYRFILKSK